MLCPCCKEDKENSFFYIDKIRKTGLSYYCKSCTTVKNKEKYEANKEKRLLKMKQYYYKNKEQLLQDSKIRCKEWREKNKDRHNAKAAKYRSSKLKASPKWADNDKIQQYYSVAKYLDWISGGFVKHHVDHIVPLQGKTVCGLHVENNLQILTSKDNFSKHNKWEF